LVISFCAIYYLNNLLHPFRHFKWLGYRQLHGEPYFNIWKTNKKPPSGTNPGGGSSYKMFDDFFSWFCTLKKTSYKAI
jgi:hypothetical protein